MVFRKLKFQPVARETYDVLKSKILAGELAPAQRVDVGSVSKQLGVSRTPVNDALQRLSVEGLIQIIPRRGTFVARATPKDVEDALHLRLALEGKACELAAVGMDASKTSVLRRLNERLGHDNHPVLADHLQINEEFHESIVEYSNNPILLRSYMQLQARMRFLQMYFGFENWRRHSPAVAHEHDEIIEALSSHNGLAAQKLMNDHIRSAMMRLISVIQTPAGSIESPSGDEKVEQNNDQTDRAPVEQVVDR
jgi:DNA-binding GntR family transcriptional regulator